MIVPFTQYQEFCRVWNRNENMCKNLRMGQAFYNWAQLHKMTQTRWLDRLYVVQNSEAEKMLLAAIDYNN